MSISPTAVLTSINGAAPTDLPVMHSAKFELVINPKSVKALGPTVPPLLLARAQRAAAVDCRPQGLTPLKSPQTRKHKQPRQTSYKHS